MRHRQYQKKKEQIALLNTDTKILDKILGDRIQQYIKRIILQDQVELISGTHDWFNTWKSEEKSHDHINGCRKKAFTKIQHLFMIQIFKKGKQKTPWKNVTTGKHAQLNKDHLQLYNIVFMLKMECFSPKMRNKGKDVHSHQSYSI